MFNPILTALASGRQVVAVDLPAHGRTADIDRPMTIEGMADDIAALANYLYLEKADIMGYSLGGEIAVLVFGDADAVSTAHAVEFFELLGGG